MFLWVFLLYIQLVYLAIKNLRQEKVFIPSGNAWLVGLKSSGLDNLCSSLSVLQVNQFLWGFFALQMKTAYWVWFCLCSLCRSRRVLYEINNYFPRDIKRFEIWRFFFILIGQFSIVKFCLIRTKVYVRNNRMLSIRNSSCNVICSEDRKKSQGFVRIPLKADELFKTMQGPFSIKHGQVIYLNFFYWFSIIKRLNME